MGSPQSESESNLEAQASNETSTGRASTVPACEACRRLKMRCTRQRYGLGSGSGPGADGLPCDRCERNNRPCHIPERRPLGRRPGALGRYRGVDKAVRQLRSQVCKAAQSSREERSNQSPADVDVLDLLLSIGGSTSPTSVPPSRYLGHSPDPGPTGTTDAPFSPLCGASTSPASSSRPPSERQSRIPEESSDHSSSPRNNEAATAGRTNHSVSNPLGLLADASGEAQAAEDSLNTCPSSLTQSVVSPGDTTSPFGYARTSKLSESLLRRPGYVSLGLQLDRGILENALETVFTRPGHMGRYANYFKSASQNQARDTGPDLDPVELGLISMEEVWYLFPLFFERLHPINGILDPSLHTPEFVRSRSAFLFTCILAISAQFDHNCGALAKRLRLHSEKLSKLVHSSGFKSIEIAQAYYISLLAAAPANTLAEDHSGTYTTYALGMTADLVLGRQHSPSDNPSGQAASSQQHNSLDDTSTIVRSNPFTLDDMGPLTSGEEWTTACKQRLVRNRERTWLRLMLWERAHSAACGKVTPFPENELTKRIEDWWRHPLADPTDRYTSAFVILRRHLAHLYHEVKQRLGHPKNKPHWVRELVDSTLEPWRQSWINPLSPRMSSTDMMRNVFLRYVYMHGRLWTLSFALHDSPSHRHDVEATRDDCFEAAVNCCETTVKDLREIGEPMYCMMAPTWAMSSYAAVLALKLFPQLYGDRPVQDVELLALLSEVALQMECAGTVPQHRFGMAALLGQHLFHILRKRLVASNSRSRNGDGESLSGPLFPTTEDSTFMSSQNCYQQPLDPTIFPLDPFLVTGLSPRGEGAAQETFAEMMREWGGPGLY